MPPKVILTTDRGRRHQRELLQAAPPGFSVTILRQPDKSLLISHLADAEYLLSERAGLIDAHIIQSAPHLKLIQRLGSFTFDIDLPAAASAGVAVCYWPIPGVIRVAEHVVMQLLGVARKLPEITAVALTARPDWAESRRTDEDTFAYNWSHRTALNQIWQRTIGILGFGEIGLELTRRLQPWGCRLLYNKRRPYPKTFEQEYSLTFASPDELYAQSDYLVNLLPYSKTTDQAVNSGVFAQMKAGAYLVSCGSGSVIDEHALAAAVRAGKIAGAALDTFEWEPLQPSNPLLLAARDGYNILLTPHTAAGTADSQEPQPARLQDYTNILNHLNNQPLRYRLV